MLPGQPRRFRPSGFCMPPHKQSTAQQLGSGDSIDAVKHCTAHLKGDQDSEGWIP